MPGIPIDECGCNDKTCDRAVPRREFIKIAGLGAVGMAAGMPVMAGPFSNENEYLKTIPIDKKLDPVWVKSLYERGEKETYTDPNALRHIGMPIGGIGAGLVYLGGDGRLWMWDVFNKPYARGFMGHGAGGDTYLKPFEPIQPFVHGFELRLTRGDKTFTRSLDRDGFAEVTFDGRYPMGIVTYKDAACAVTAQLEAFSPFIPLDLENSSYPATVMRYTLKYTSTRAVEATVTGWVDDPVCVYTGWPTDTLRRNTIRRSDHAAVLQCTAEKPAAGRKIEARPDIVFEDFEKSDYADWQVAGEAFGKGSVAIQDIPDYQGEINGLGKRVVNSHASAPRNSVVEKDNATGSLLSRPFKIERNYITLRIGGGQHSERQHAREFLAGEKPTVDDKAGTSVNLLIDGKVVRSLTGHNHNKMRCGSMDVSALRGKTGRLMIVDAVSGPWGNIGADQIVFTDTAAKPDAGPLQHVEFSARLAPDDFRAAFTAAQGWGTFEQKMADGISTAELSVKWGEVSLQTLRLSPKLRNTNEVTVTYAGKKLTANVVTNESSAEITLNESVTVAAGEQLKVVLQ